MPQLQASTSCGLSLVMNGRIQVKPRPGRLIPYKHPLTGGRRLLFDLQVIAKPLIDARAV